MKGATVKVEEQRLSALAKGNEVRVLNAELKRRLDVKDASESRRIAARIIENLDDQHDGAKRIRVVQFLEAIRQAGPSSVNKWLNRAGISRAEFTKRDRKVDRGSILKLAEAAKESPEDAQAVWQKVTDKSRPGHSSIKTALREVRDEKVVVSITKKADDLVKVHHGDFYALSADLEDGSIDAIITDPPYPQEFLHTWAQMAEVGMRVLKPGGWCIAYSGKMHLDEVILMMRDAGLRFYWQIVFKQTVQAVVHPRKVNTRYKPILVFQKPPIAPQEAYIADMFEGEGVQKDRHEWQQSEGGFEFLIENFTKAGDTILEPFAGGGTCPAVAKRMNRYCIAYELDERAHAQTCDRLWGSAA